MPASAGTDRQEGKTIFPNRCLGDACRLEGGAPGRGLLRHPRGKGVQLPGCLLVPVHGQQACERPEQQGHAQQEQVQIHRP